jgi:glyoxylase-like metal-dependent hydrolase (beta-lactamase superfamily II)
MSEPIPLDDAARLHGAHSDDTTREIAPDLAYKRLAIVNIVFYGAPGAADRQWVLIDSGVVGTSSVIASAARKRFGKDSRPAAIILTHGHFDHVAGLKELSEHWDVPIYAHVLEHPYLDGRSAYQLAKPVVSSGLLALLSPLFPGERIEIGSRLHALPDDGSVPAMRGWRWFHTPGHAPGHVSLWRESDRTLVVGDAFITTDMESAYAVTVQKRELHGPPMFVTQDWREAGKSVAALAELEPELVITGHGEPMDGEEMRRALHQLADHFDELAAPQHGG